jgi:CRP/FNR family transcriptional regulator, cyclic AMP receptor protein
MVDSETLSRFSLFADLESPQLEALAHMFDEERFANGTRVIREGLSGSGFYVILEGLVSVRVDGQERAQLRAGDFFGEVSILAGGPASADVVAVSDHLACALLPGPELRTLLLDYPSVAVRMLEAGARRLRTANRWQP